MATRKRTLPGNPAVKKSPQPAKPAPAKNRGWDRDRSKDNPPASPARIAILEALERHGGSLRSRNGVQARLIACHGQLAATSNLAQVLRNMETAGLIALNEVPGNRNGKKITEALLVEIPVNFLAPIAHLRAEKGIAFNPAQPLPSDEPEVEEEVDRTRFSTSGGFPEGGEGPEPQFPDDLFKETTLPEHPSGAVIPAPPLQLLGEDELPVMRLRADMLAQENRELVEENQKLRQDLEEAATTIKALSRALLANGR